MYNVDYYDISKIYVPFGQFDVGNSIRGQGRVALDPSFKNCSVTITYSIIDVPVIIIEMVNI